MEIIYILIKAFIILLQRKHSKASLGGAIWQWVK
jgi:hypothetical protein